MTSDELLQLYQKLALEGQEKFIAKLARTKQASPGIANTAEGDAHVSDAGAESTALRQSACTTTLSCTI